MQERDCQMCRMTGFNSPGWAVHSPVLPVSADVPLLLTKKQAWLPKQLRKKRNIFLNITLRSEDHRIILRRFSSKGGWPLWGFLSALPRTTRRAEGAAHCTNGAALWVTQLQNLSGSVMTNAESKQQLGLLCHGQWHLLEAGKLPMNFWMLKSSYKNK